MLYICIYICVYHTFMNFVKHFTSSNHLKKAGKRVCIHYMCTRQMRVEIRVYIHPIHWYHFSTYQQILDKRTQKCVRHTCLNFLCGFHIHVERKYISDYWKPFLHPRAIIFKKKKKTWMRYGCLHYICTRRMCWKNVYAWFFDTISAAMGWLRLVGSLKL